MNLRVAGLAWLLALGCAGNPSPPAAAPPAPPPRSPSLPDAIAPRGPLAPATEVARIVEPAGYAYHRYELTPAAGPLRRFVVGGRPVELEGDDVRPAVGAFRDADVEPLPAPDGWRFIAGGGVWAASEFLGPYRLVAGSSGALAGRGVGRPTFVRDGVVEGVALPSTVVDAAFSDDLRGVAIVEPGVALATQDGLRWTPVAGLDEAPRSVLALADQRWVLGATHALQIDPGGAVARRHRRDAPGLVEVTSGTTTPELTPERTSEWFPLAFMDDTRRQVLATDRRFAREGSRYFVYDLNEGRALGAVEPPPRCERPRFFGAGRVFATCATDEGTTLYERGDDGTWWERLGVRWCGARPTSSYGETHARCCVSATGGSVACEGRCSERDVCGLGTEVCERVARGVARRRSAGSIAEPWQVAGYDGEDLVFVDGRSYLRHARVVRGDGAAVPLATNPERDERWVVERDTPLGRDGRLRMVVQVLGSERHEVWEGRVGGAFEVRPLPPWATTAAESARVRVCGAEGELLALAADGTPWVSTRGARAWHPFIPPGAPDDLSGLAWSPRVTEPPSCDELGWTHDARVVGWGAPSIAPESALSFGPPTGGPSRSGPAPWRCELVNPPRDADREERTLPGDWLRWRQGAADPGGRAVVVDAPQDGRRAAPIHLTLPRRLPRELASFFTLDVTRARALLFSRGSGTPLTLYAVTSAGAVVRLWQDRSGTVANLMAEIVAHDGDSYAMLSEYNDAHAPEPWRSHAQALFVSAPGRAPSLGTVTLARGRVGRVGVYALGAEAGWLRVRPDGNVLGGRAGELPRVIARGVRRAACGPGARGDFVLRASASVSGQEVPAVAEHYRLEGDVLCPEALVLADVALRAGDAGYVSGPGWTPVRCTPPSE